MLGELGIPTLTEHERRRALKELAVHFPEIFGTNSWGNTIETVFNSAYQVEIKKSARWGNYFIARAGFLPGDGDPWKESSLQVVAEDSRNWRLECHLITEHPRPFNVNFGWSGQRNSPLSRFTGMVLHPNGERLAFAYYCKGGFSIRHGGREGGLSNLGIFLPINGVSESELVNAQPGRSIILTYAQERPGGVLTFSFSGILPVGEVPLRITVPPVVTPAKIRSY